MFCGVGGGRWDITRRHDMAFLWRKKDAKGLLSVFRVMKDTRNVRDRPLENLWGGGRGAGEGQKKNTRKGKKNEKKK